MRKQMVGQNIHDEQWQTLIVLDACRFDCFEEICLPHLQGALEPRWSPASCTREWLKSQCINDFSDTVYISANPYGSQRAFESQSYRLQMPWPFGGEEAIWDWGFDKELGTVRPDVIPPVVKRYPPAQRLVIHCMQPHHPFIFEGKRLFEFEKDHGWGPTRDYIRGEGEYPSIYTEWKAVEEGLVPVADVIAAYKKNLEGIIPALQEIVAYRTDGITIITADHGELFEPPYRHPCESDHPDLHTVPWFVVEPIKGTPVSQKNSIRDASGRKVSSLRATRRTALKEDSTVARKKSKIDGSWYDFGYWETAQKGGKGGYDSIASLEYLSGEIAEQFAQVFGWNENTCLLDAGCGPGFMVARWRALGLEAYGIDASSYALQRGAEISPVVKEYCYIGELINLSAWPDEAFDVVHCNQVLEHIYPEDVPQVAQEFARVLRPGGMLICAMPMSAPWEEDPRPDEREPSHVNVRKIEYWHDWFGGVGLLINQDAMIKFVTEAEVWKRVRWEMVVYWKPKNDIPITPTPDDGEKSIGLG